jgi:putative copper export protein
VSAALLVGADVPSLAPSLTGTRLILHVLGAAVWVGGQITVTGLLPTVRGFGGDAPRQVARALGRLLWPAYALVVVTGFWNIAALDTSAASSAWKAVLMAKIAIVAVAGVAVFLHQRAATPRGKAVFGAIGGVTSVLALALGVFLAG